jgi:hypothetical protein
VQSSKPSWESKVLSKNDTFTRVHEDPLLLIKQQEKKTRESILSNPIKLAKLREQVEAQIEKPHKDHKERKHVKHEKKDKKKDKKRDRDESVDRSKSRQRSRSRDRSPMRGSRSESRQQMVSSRDERDRYESRSREERPRHDSAHHRKRERSESTVRDYRRRSPSPKRHDDGVRRREDGYGLVKGRVNADSSNSSSSAYLGPKQELIKQRMDDERAELARKKQQSQRSRPLADEEREQKIREMEENARISEEMRLRRLNQAQAHVDAERRDQQKQAGADFLKSMRSEVYSNTDITMEERLKQNRHYSQRGVDLDSHGFMNK